MSYKYCGKSFKVEISSNPYYAYSVSFEGTTEYFDCQEEAKACGEELVLLSL